MRFRFTFFAILFTVGVFAVPLAAQAAIPFFGPIIPQTGDQAVCAAGWGMLMIVVNNVISLLITLAIVFVAPLMIAYSGFLFVVNPVNAAGKEQAKGILTHTVVGIVIALAGWMIVNAIMVVIYNPDAGSGTTRLSAWSNLITSDGSDLCLKLQGSIAPPAAPPTVAVPAVPGRFTFDPGINAQVATESGPLAALLSCMVSKVPAGVGRISSISDSKIVSGQYTFQQCAARGSAICAHTINSCHYGGTGSCNGSSYAVDFGDEQNATVLSAAAVACGGKILNEGNHIHVSVGAANGCNCDSRL